MISVVIPAYNEQALIGKCLNKLIDQGRSIGEIIVVDNGSTDDTAKIVSNYAHRFPHIRLVEEPARGVANARNTGIEAANHEIVGRIDADTLVPPGWADIIEGHLSENLDTSAVTGMSTYHDSPIGIFRRLAIKLAIRLGLLGGQQCNLYGANMAIRRDVWKSVVEHATTRSDLHEDVDLALCMSKRGYRIDQLTNLNVEVSARRRAMSPVGMWEYHTHSIRTMRNQGWNITFPIRFCIGAVLVIHTAQWPLYRTWDFENRRYTLRRVDARNSPVIANSAN